MEASVEATPCPGALVRVRDSRELGEGQDQLPPSCTPRADRYLCLCRRESKSNRYGLERVRGTGWVAAELHVSVCTCWVV